MDLHSTCLTKLQLSLVIKFLKTQSGSLIDSGLGIERSEVMFMPKTYTNCGGRSGVRVTFQATGLGGGVASGVSWVTGSLVTVIRLSTADTTHGGWVRNEIQSEGLKGLGEKLGVWQMLETGLGMNDIVLGP
ncbi:hypothetical protein RIF29_19333 [Crotalaria pallida]|uniref:Uncharacterized protein n=1 Tax=Crotalaria pallida TaxID=3830 RepID=A0AAN9F367_CROPI